MGDSGASFGGRERKGFQGAGGTPGGLVEFFVGAGLAAVGIYLLFNQVQVHTSYWRFGGLANSFGITLIPMLIGVGVLFVNGKSKLGWALAIGGLLFILAGIVANMDVYFTPTTLWNTLLMLGLLASGMGLVVKSLRPHRTREEPR